MKKSDLILTALIFLGLIAGVVVGQFVLFDANATQEAINETVRPWQSAGELLFFRPLQLMILPIVFVSVVAALRVVIILTGIVVGLVFGGVAAPGGPGPGDCG